jgi:hypothetical protein
MVDRGPDDLKKGLLFLEESGRVARRNGLRDDGLEEKAKAFRSISTPGTPIHVDRLCLYRQTSHRFIVAYMPIGKDATSSRAVQ